MKTIIIFSVYKPVNSWKNEVSVMDFAHSENAAEEKIDALTKIYTKPDGKSDHWFFAANAIISTNHQFVIRPS
jgi:hypothetical protein